MFRVSLYNYFVEYNDRVVYSNGLSGFVFSVNKNEHEKLQSLLFDLITFEINFNSVFKRFVDWGFIIDDKINEIDIIRYNNKKATVLSKDYNLVVNPTLECNFNCWYCYENHPLGYMNLETLELIKKHIKYMVEVDRITSLTLSWFGGEPLLYFDDIVFVISLYAKQICDCNKIEFINSITTNGYLMNFSMIEKMKLIDMNQFQITLDGARKRHDKIRNYNGIPSFDKIMNNIEMLCKSNSCVNIILRINYDNKTLNDVMLKSIFDNIPVVYRKNIRPNFQAVWQTIIKEGGENKEKKDIVEYCNELGFKSYSPSNSFSFGKLYTCYVDRYYHAEINYDGRVYSCTAREYSDKYVTGKINDIGLVEWNENERIKQYARATFENDMCLYCKYLPLCMGPCSQKIKETPNEKLHEICYLNFTEIKPETVIIDHYIKKMKSLNNNM